MSLRCPSRDTATYPDYDTVGENGIHVSGVTYTESRYRMEYYVNTLKSMDDFLGSLTEALEKYPEPVMLVVYGDHMPSLVLTENDISYGSLYYTEYVFGRITNRRGKYAISNRTSSEALHFRSSVSAETR